MANPERTEADMVDDTKDDIMISPPAANDT